ncbi:unnamed protein product [Phytophthora fragariaefolia]|uniref:Unnamed protein product n=1 Tax=Phytophthora fragariaefolia TaxID=1490495 RepID=A0A9W6XZC4_9STRA|nr:unnamed protein product [Phytophthora fragariaefolia]
MRVLLVVEAALLAVVGGLTSTFHDSEHGTPQLQLLTDEDAATCYWQSGLSCDLDTLTNDMKLGEVGRCEVPVPIPTDNYVSDLRRNKFDNAARTVASQRPFIQITSSKRGGVATAATAQSTWYQYVTNPTPVQNQITFSSPGKYDMEIIAKDYDFEATCIGCIAILDKYRPRYGNADTCPTNMPTTAQTLTRAKQVEFQGYDNAYRKYTADSNVVNNPNSAILCTSTDADRFGKLKNFYDSEKDCSTTCFDDSTLATNVGKLKTTPFTVSTQTAYNLQSSYTTMEPLLNAKCTWCCRKTRTLKEMYVEYYCPNDYENDPDDPTASCQGGIGIPNTCSFNLCLKATGPDVVTTSVTIKSTIQTASTAVPNALPSKPAGSDATKHVYYSIPCTTFDKTNTNCRYTVKLSQLLDVPTAFTTTFPTPVAELTKVKDYPSSSQTRARPSF